VIQKKAPHKMVSAPLTVRVIRNYGAISSLLPNPNHPILSCYSVLDKNDVYSNYSYQDCADIVQDKAPNAKCSSLGYNVDSFTGKERGKRCYACY